MDVAVPMASLPTEMSGRNWMMRRLIIDSIRNDPEWMNGNYTKQPRSLQFASVFYGIATSGGNQALYKATPTREKADQLLNQRLSAPFRGDANDHLYQWDASRDYNASLGLERIQAVMLAINSADDEPNPPELGLLDREIKPGKRGRVLLIPANEQTPVHDSRDRGGEAAHRGLQTRTARTRLRSGTEHRHRAPTFCRERRVPSTPRGRTGGSQGRRDPDVRDESNTCCQASDRDDPYRDADGARPCWS